MIPSWSSELTAVLEPDGSRWVVVAWDAPHDRYVMIPEGALCRTLSGSEYVARRNLGYVKTLPKGSDKGPKLAPLGSDFDPWLGV